MLKTGAVASLGQDRLVLPAWVKGALSANDRLKVYLTLLQMAAHHASHRDGAPDDLASELSAAGLHDGWLREFAASATRLDGNIVVPALSRLVQSLRDDLAIMARPVLQTSTGDTALHARVRHWLEWLDRISDDRFSDADVEALTRGRREAEDSLHVLVMDLHIRLNQLAAELATEVIDGANVWELSAEDRPRVAAFMRGLNRTAKLKFDHPGLDTSATRDGERLLLQNDIGTNDAHVLVMQVMDHSVTLTYSDLHRSRLAFFQSMLAPFGARWSARQSRTDARLNDGGTFSIATATFQCADEHNLQATLEGIGSRIVFLIDWNRARKRLQSFVGKEPAMAVLETAARLDAGHRAWLQLGGEQLIFDAMQASGEGAFRIGDRLDDVMGTTDASAFLVDVMRLSCEALRESQPVAQLADEIRMLLVRHVRQRTTEFDLLSEQAAYCHALAQAVCDGLAHGVLHTPKAAQALAARAKEWERTADLLVMQARDKAARQPRWRTFVRLAEQSDDVSDALEEAAFLIGLIAEDHHKGWTPEVREVLARLSSTVLEAVQDHVKALAIARMLGSESATVDTDAFLASAWRVLQAERKCDVLLREARRVILDAVHDAPSLMLANDLAVTLEEASDRLLQAAYGLREVAFDKAGVAG